jgi:cyclic pyranopterin phosphate synthase
MVAGREVSREGSHGTARECLKDALGRPLNDLRLSVTDRCNFRCAYCMPLDRYEWINRREILTFEEIVRLSRIFVSLGVEEIRLTGGEPLLRHKLCDLVGRLAELDGLGLKDLSLTTNASFLGQHAAALRRSGVRRINVSLDTIDPQKFRAMTRRDDLANVLQGLLTAKGLGIAPIKVNCVVQRGVNDEDILPLTEFARRNGFWLRFIEYMDVGNANRWESEKIVPKREILERIGARYPLEEVGRSDPNAPAVNYRFKDGGGDIGVIASVTEPFCAGCTRGRLSADGRLVLCLFSDKGVDLKKLLRGGADDREVASVIREAWTSRRDRYSEERLEAMNSGSYRADSRRKIEMISIGG